MTQSASGFALPMARASRRVRVRRWAARAALLLPGVAIVGADWAWRRALIADYSTEATRAHAARALLSIAVWAALAAAAGRRRGFERIVARVAMAGVAFLALGTQLYTALRYGTYLCWRTALMGTSLLPSFGHRAVAVVAYLAPPLLVLLALRISTRLAPTRRIAARASLGTAAALLGAAFAFGSPTAGWDNGAPPDVLYLGAAGALARSKMSGDDIMTKLPNLPAARSPRAVAAVAPAKPVRNVVLVVTESVRAMDVCSAPDPSCDATPFTNASLPNRLGLRGMRAVDSTTSISLAVLLTGLSPASPRAELLSSPLLFEHARAAGYETAYFTSQNLLFANSGRWLDSAPLSRELSATEYEPYASYQCGADDATLVTRALGEIGRMKEPFFGVVHLSNTHFPYCAYEDAPGGDPVTDDSEEALLLSRYRAAIKRQDKHVARLVAGLRATPAGANTVVIFVSDHGEQLRERGQVGHTWSLYDEEIRVPFWVDGPLDEGERASLAALEDVPVTMLDVAPTVLDLMGVGPAKEMLGTSLLRGGSSSARPTLLTNCSPLVSCATKNWGAMRGTRKLIATEDEPGGWRCVDVAADPGERFPGDPEACGDLRALAEADGRGAPFDGRP
jgi:arylsulfatase A-like enzyme